MSEECQRIHEIFNKLRRFRFPFNEKEIPTNGIYVLFERGEDAHGADRIVRIGTHTGANQLRSRLFQHFVNMNKDRSIFRKNIGRAILNKNKDNFLRYWEIDLTTKEARKKFGDKIDLRKQKEVENLVSKYIQENFSFAVFGINDLRQRLKLESKIISTLSLCDNCGPSKNWLGNFSPKEKIRGSGLWLVNELNKEPLLDEDIEIIEKLISNNSV